MIYLYFMSLFLLTMYIMYAVRVCGVPWSLSDTYYQLKKRNRPAVPDSYDCSCHAAYAGVD